MRRPIYHNAPQSYLFIFLEEPRNKKGSPFNTGKNLWTFAKIYKLNDPITNVMLARVLTSNMGGGCRVTPVIHH